MRLAPPLCCKLLRQVPTFFIIMKRLEALESSWEFKKKTTKNKNTRAHNCFHCHRYANRELQRADRQRHQLSAAIHVFLLHFGFVPLSTLTKERFAARSSPTLEKGYVLGVPAMHNLPATRDLLLPALPAGWKPVHQG